jgi:hypothetical protein
MMLTKPMSEMTHNKITLQVPGNEMVVMCGSR